jgi:hypothetical protein
VSRKLFLLAYNFATPALSLLLPSTSKTKKTYNWKFIPKMRPGTMTEDLPLQNTTKKILKEKCQKVSKRL